MYSIILLDPWHRYAPVKIHQSRSRREAFASAKAWDRQPNGRVAVAWPHWAPMPEDVRDLDDVCENGE